MLPTPYYLFLSLALFLVGLIGLLTRRNLVIRLLALELLLIASSINLMAFARLFADATGQLFAMLVILLSIVELFVGLAIIASVFRRWPVSSPNTSSVNR